MRVLILGKGGREHALAWKIHQSPKLDQLFVAPGNPGTAQIADNIDLDIEDFSAVAGFIQKNEIQLCIVGPELPLVNGIADFLNTSFPDLHVVGPKKTGALLEGSKEFAKAFMYKYGIPTANYTSFSKGEQSKLITYLDTVSTPVVLKADGLAAGKGVLICETQEEAKSAAQEIFSGKFGDAGDTIVVEEFLTGREFSVFILTNGRHYHLLPIAKDYKRIGEGDQGLNTGGMGTVSPVSFVNGALMQKVVTQIIEPTISGIQKENIDYQGFLFFGLIEVNGEPYVIEYNCRLGDPETQVILPRMDADLLQLIEDLPSLSENKRVHTQPNVALCTILASGGYPEKYNKGEPIHNADIDKHFGHLFHAGTQINGNTLVTDGGRVLAAVGIGKNIQSAREHSLHIADDIQFKNKYFRSDIGFDLM